MSPEERANHEYLGDGVYVQITPQFIILRTGSHKDEDCDNKIFLESKVLMNFLDWVKAKFPKEQ